jgi:hypothetical protein
MADEVEKAGSRPMNETISKVEGTKKIGLPPDRKKAADHILKSYADSPETRDPRIMENFEDSMNEEPKSIGERIEGN